MGVMTKKTHLPAISGVQMLPLKQIIDDRGKVMHMLRADSPLFKRFGEIYFSMINPGTIKAWKRHQKMTQHIAVPVGKIRPGAAVWTAARGRGSVLFVPVSDD